MSVCISDLPVCSIFLQFSRFPSILPSHKEYYLNYYQAKNNPEHYKEKNICIKPDSPSAGFLSLISNRL